MQIPAPNPLYKVLGMLTQSNALLNATADKMVSINKNRIFPKIPNFLNNTTNGLVIK